MTGIILAAGRSTRIGRAFPKVLLKLNRRPVLEYVIKTCRAAGLSRIIVVVGFQRKRVERAFTGWDVEFAVQPKQRGTADAVLSCQGRLSARENVVVLSGDVPLVTAATLKRLVLDHQRQRADMTLLVATVAQPKGYGRILRKRGGILDVIEEKDARASQRRIKEMNVGLYVLRWGRVLPLLKRIEPSPRTGEYYLPKLVKLVADQGGTVCGVETNDPAEFMGINTLQEHRQVEQELKRRCAL